MSSVSDKSTLYEQQAIGHRIINPVLSRYTADQEPFTGRPTLFENRFYREEPNSKYTRWLTDDGVNLHTPHDFETGEFPDRPRIWNGKLLDDMTPEELLVAAKQLYDGVNVANLYVERTELLPVPMPVHFPLVLKAPAP